MLELQDPVAPAEDVPTPTKEPSNGHAKMPDSQPESSDKPALDQHQGNLIIVEEEQVSPEVENSNEPNNVKSGEDVEITPLQEDLSDPIRPEELEAMIKLEPVDFDEDLPGKLMQC
jgi:hypothetical protein